MSANKQVHHTYKYSAPTISSNVHMSSSSVIASNSSSGILSPTAQYGKVAGANSKSDCEFRYSRYQLNSAGTNARQQIAIHSDRYQRQSRDRSTPEIGYNPMPLQSLRCQPCVYEATINRTSGLEIATHMPWTVNRHAVIQRKVTRHTYAS